jgi:DnaJ-class molecular chaperone
MKWRELQRGYEDRLTQLRALLERDPYAILGSSSDATDHQVKLAYRRTMATYHPDRQDEFLRSYAQEVAKLANSAYQKIQESRKK